MRRTLWSKLGVVAVLALTGAGCGERQGRTEAERATGTAAACEPVGRGGGTEVAVALDEWSVESSPAGAPAGTVTFQVRNAGEEPHELVVVRGVAPEALRVVAGKVDEEALPNGAFIGEVEAFPAGETCSGTFDLPAGSYTLFCNIVEEHDGKPESHFQEGMVTTFEVD